MKIGTVKEVKRHEYRVGLTPSCVRSFVAHGHDVLVEQGCGIEAGFDDEHYLAHGAQVISDRKQVYDDCDMIVKVKEPQQDEYQFFREGQILYTYLHLAADRDLTHALLDRGVNAVAYETIEDAGRLPCLKPMSEIAGRLSVQEGAKYLEKPFGGRGVLMSGVPGVKPAKVTIIGGGIVGCNACRIALGMGADVTVLDIDPAQMSHIEEVFDARATTLFSTETNIEASLYESDLVIGAVLVPGAKAPKVVRREHLKHMKRGAVIADVAVDQGGCVETTTPTTHDNPTFEVDGVIHYCVANMPGAVPLTSTQALVIATLPYGLMIAEHGLVDACRKSIPARRGLNIYKGRCVNQAVANAFDIPYVSAESCLGVE